MILLASFKIWSIQMQKVKWCNITPTNSHFTLFLSQMSRHQLNQNNRSIALLQFPIDVKLCISYSYSYSRNMQLASCILHQMHFLVCRYGAILRYDRPVSVFLLSLEIELELESYVWKLYPKWSPRFCFFRKIYSQIGNAVSQKNYDQRSYWVITAEKRKSPKHKERRKFMYIEHKFNSVINCEWQ